MHAPIEDISQDSPIEELEHELLDDYSEDGDSLEESDGEAMTNANYPLAWADPKLAQKLKKIITKNYSAGYCISEDASQLLLKKLPGEVAEKLKTADPKKKYTKKNKFLNAVSEILGKELTKKYEDILLRICHTTSDSEHFGVSAAVLIGNPKRITGKWEAPLSENVVPTVLWEGATGTANPITGDQIIPDMHFGLGSVTKVFTATLVLKMVEEAEIELKSRLIDHIHILAQNTVISCDLTIEGLLRMEGGIDSFALNVRENKSGIDKHKWNSISVLSQLREKRDWETVETISLSEWSFDHLKKLLSGEEIEKLGVLKDKHFKSEKEFWREMVKVVGQDQAFFHFKTLWNYAEKKYPARYSNSNYLLAGMILANLHSGDEREVNRLFHEKLFDPLGLKEIYMAGKEEERLPRPVSFVGPFQLDPDRMASKYYQAFTTGALVGTVADVAFFFDALFRKKTVLDMVDLFYPTSGPRVERQYRPIKTHTGPDGIPLGYCYGMGVMKWLVPESSDDDFQLSYPLDNPPTTGTMLFGHMGSINGFATLAFYDPGKATTIVLQTNNCGFYAQKLFIKTYIEIVNLLQKSLH